MSFTERMNAENSNKTSFPDTLPETMIAMVMEKPGQRLIRKILPLPKPGDQQVLIKIIACGVCRTDLHIMDGELSEPKLPLIMGHEIVGRVIQLGSTVSKLKLGQLIGVPWVAYTCGHCKFCRNNKENLCENALFTGYTMDGGYAQYTVAFQDHCFPLSSEQAKPSSAPLLCASLIGFRSYRMIAPNAVNIGIYGFGAAAHILIQVALKQGKRIFAFTRDGDDGSQKFALHLGAHWAGDASISPPEKMDAAIIFAPVGELVPKALRDIDKGCSVICGGIHMSDIPAFPYNLLWEERTITSVANLTRQDGYDFLELVSGLPLKIETRIFALQQANEALAAVRSGQIKGAAVLVM